MSTKTKKKTYAHRIKYIPEGTLELSAKYFSNKDKASTFYKYLMEECTWRPRIIGTFEDSYEMVEIE